ncbi:heavy metal sensor histidine kinase [Chitinibacter sp. S2-10]|uniref:heavy metal sensor histidine kinase n=1 Tax=Chitinibacter sp. S2-10 TaxID=3373597 RepID=UPI0039777A87
MLINPIRKVSISFRIGLIISLLSTTTALLTGLSLDYLLNRTLHNRAVNELTEKLSSVDEIRDVSSHKLLPLMQIGHPDMHWVIIENNTIALSSDTYADEIHRLLLENNIKFSEFIRFRSNLIGIRTISNVKVMLILDIKKDELIIEQFREYLFGIMTLTTILSALISFKLAKKGLIPLVDFSNSMKLISARSLEHNINAKDQPSELQDLSKSFSDLLIQIKYYMSRLSQFSGDLAHEMRTPLCKIMSTIQFTLSKPRSCEEYSQVLGSVEENLEAINKMISDMLFIAHTDEETCLSRAEWFNVQELAAQAVEFYDALSDEKSLILSVHGDGSLFGDKQMIARAIINLLSNAIRHAEKNSEVKISISEIQSYLKISVANRGLPIPNEHIPYLMDRFYRADTSRDRHQGGVGLGLAIVSSILRLHNGKLEVRCENGTTYFTMNFLLP